MDTGRNFYIRNKPVVILDKRFKFIKDLGVGQTGQLLIDGIKEKEFLKMDNDDVERIRYIIKITDAEMISPKELSITLKKENI